MMNEAVWYAGVQLRRRGIALTIEAIQGVLYERVGVIYGRSLVLEGLASLLLEHPQCLALVFAEERDD